MIDQAKKLVMQAFDEIDGCLGYCHSATDGAWDQEISEAYANMASSKLDNASTLMSLGEKKAFEQTGEGSQDAKYAWSILSDVVNERIRSARAVLSSIRR